MIVELLLGAAALCLAVDNLRLRRSRRGGGQEPSSTLTEIEGIPLPSADDPRWKLADQEIHRTDGHSKNVGTEEVLRLGLFVVAKDGWVFVQRPKGLADSIPGSQRYGRSCWAAYDAQRALNSMIEAT